MTVQDLIAELQLLREELERADPVAAERARTYAALIQGPRITLHWSRVWPVGAGSSLQVSWQAPSRCLITDIAIATPDGLDVEVAVGNVVVLAGAAEALASQWPMAAIEERVSLNVLLRNPGASPLHPENVSLLGFPLARN